MSVICSKALLYSIILMLGSITFGYVIVYASPAIEDMRKSFTISKTEEQFYKSISALTAIAGPFISEFLLSFLGRKPTTAIISFFASLFWLMLTFTSSSIFWYGILCRALMGLTMGAFSSIIPLYIVELSPVEAIGFFGSLNQLGIALGVVICYLVGNFVNWKGLAYVGMSISCLLIFLVWLVPEPTNQSNDTELSETEAQVGTLISESILQKKFIRPMFMGIMMMVFQQFSSINGILNNLTKLFKSAGVPLGEGIASAIAATAQVIAVLLGSLIIDRLGKRNTFIISTGGTACSLLIYALTIRFNWGAVLPIVAIFLFLLFYGVGLGPIPWFIMPEILEQSVRSVGTSIVSSTNWVFAFLIIMVYQYVYDAMGEFWTMIMFMFIMIGGAVFGWFFVGAQSDSCGSVLVQALDTI